MRIAALFSGLTLIVVLLLNWGAPHRKATDHPNHVSHPNGTMLSVTFAHADHVNQQCIECHHNFIDDTGTGLCFDCHKSDPEVAELIETQFHTLCRDCHVSEARNTSDERLTPAGHGPLRACASCHTADNRP